MNNFVMLFGHLGADPELKTFDNGNQCATFTMATSQTFKTKSGEKKTNTQWHNIIVWGARAKVICDYFKKGSKIQLSGMIKYETYQSDGVTKYFTRIEANDFEFIEKQSKRQTAPEPQQEEVIDEETYGNKDDLPF